MDKVRRNRPGDDLELLRRAYDFAAEQHKTQTRLSGEPFLSHPVEVAHILADMKLDVTSLCAALLHDVVEDTKIPLETISEHFGVDVARLDEGGLARFRAEKIGFIFQQFHLIAYLTALENVMLAQYFHSTTDEAEAREALGRVGLADRMEHLPGQLSGGEQQRVAVARALINSPKLILADEPTGNLDEANEGIVLKLLRELHADGHTILMVTHAPSIGELADRRIDLAHGRLAVEHAARRV